MRGFLGALMTKAFDLLDDENSVSKLADLDQDQLQKIWLHYKKTFKFKLKST